MRYRIVSWSGEPATSDATLRERTSSLAVALKLARWSLEDGNGAVTVYEDERPFTYRTVQEIEDAADAAGVRVPA